MSHPEEVESDANEGNFLLFLFLSLSFFYQSWSWTDVELSMVKNGYLIINRIEL